MIEDSIKELASAINALAEAITRASNHQAAFGPSYSTKTNSSSKPASAPQPEEPTEELTESPETNTPGKPALEPATPVTLEQIQNLCLQKVRATPAAKKLIKEILASYNGAKLIKEVDSSNYEELFSKLEAI